MITMREQLLAESKGVKDSVKWLNKRIKARKKELESHRWGILDDVEYREKAIISEMVSIKIGLEKYAKKLKHMANEVFY